MSKILRAILGLSLPISAPAEQFESFPFFQFFTDPELTQEHFEVNVEPFISQRGSGLEDLIQIQSTQRETILHIINTTYELLKPDITQAIHPVPINETEFRYKTAQEIIEKGKARCIGRVIVAASLFEEAQIEYIVIQSLNLQEKTSHVYLAVPHHLFPRTSKSNTFTFENDLYSAIEMGYNVQRTFRTIPVVPKDIKKQTVLAIYRPGEFMIYAPKIKWLR